MSGLTVLFLGRTTFGHLENYSLGSGGDPRENPGKVEISVLMHSLKSLNLRRKFGNSEKV